jgi:hypothetical protein
MTSVSAFLRGACQRLDMASAENFAASPLTAARTAPGVALDARNVA